MSGSTQESKPPPHPKEAENEPKITALKHQLDGNLVNRLPKMKTVKPNEKGYR